MLVHNLDLSNSDYAIVVSRNFIFRADLSTHSRLYSTSSSSCTVESTHRRISGDLVQELAPKVDDRQVVARHKVRILIAESIWSGQLLHRSDPGDL